MSEKYLAMYDIRGIQNYIFRTNAIKEIIGASSIVENIITDGFKQVLKDHGWEQESEKYRLDWENDDVAILTDAQIQMQVMFIGGGNAYVMYQNEELCHTVNRALAKYVLEKTYSLMLAVAVIPMSDDYSKDYKKINEEMQRIKGSMPESTPIGAFPFMAADSKTGFPLTHINPSNGELISTETMLKLQAYKRLGENLTEEERILDHYIKEKNDSSVLGIVHIDGNSMGNRIKELMHGVTDYRDAILRMRTISMNIKQTYNQVFDRMHAEVTESHAKVKKDAFMVRRIITAGDDITYVVNGQAALSSAEIFLKYLDGACLYEKEENSKEQNLRDYGFSACAGIAFINSHFPFSDGYEVAEACCESAKARAKSAEHTVDGIIGNFVDFQICEHISTSDLSAYRRDNYMIGAKKLWKRPYYVETIQFGAVTGLNEANRSHCFEHFKAQSTWLKTLARSAAKKLRNSYGLGRAEEYMTFLSSRGIEMPEEVFDEQGVANWYDALEMMDLFIDLTKEEC